MPRQGRRGRSNRVRLVEDVKPKLHQRWAAQLLLALWRWLPEIAASVGVVTVFIYLTRQDLPAWAAACVLVAPVTAGLSVPPVRRVIVALFWLDVTRHRLRAFMAENGLRNHSGRLPWLAFIYPTRIGERAWMFLVAGVTCHDVEERLASLGSTCYAREGRVEAHKKFSHLIRIDISRRDLLAAKTPVPSRLIDTNKTDPDLVPAVDSLSNPASSWAVGIGLPLSPPTATARNPARRTSTHSRPPRQRRRSLPNPPRRTPPQRCASTSWRCALLPERTSVIMSSLLKVVPGRKAGGNPTHPSPASPNPQVSGLSAYDPIHIGIDEYGENVDIPLVHRNLLAGGVMGAGKSGFLSNIIGHISQTTDGRIIGIDGKLVELMMWQETLDFFVGRDPDLANHVLRQLIEEMERRYTTLSRQRRRKIRRGDGTDLIFVLVDELAAFTTLFGTRDQQEEFINNLLELVALGRAVGIVVVAATQRPSATVVPTKLRDIFSYRCAFRCATPASSRHDPGRSVLRPRLRRLQTRPVRTRRRLLHGRRSTPLQIPVRLPDRRRHRHPRRPLRLHPLRTRTGGRRMNTHVIRVVRNTAQLVTADSVRDTDRCDFLTHADAADFAETIVAGFPWGWSCSCGLTATAYRNAADRRVQRPRRTPPPHRPPRPSARPRPQGGDSHG